MDSLRRGGARLGVEGLLRRMGGEVGKEESVYAEGVSIFLIEGGAEKDILLGGGQSLLLVGKPFDTQGYPRKLLTGGGGKLSRRGMTGMRKGGELFNQNKNRKDFGGRGCLKSVSVGPSQRT